MRIVVFGLAVSSSWGNGHATLWRGLIRALHDLGCVVVFERDVPYYAGARDVTSPGGELVLYRPGRRRARGPHARSAAPSASSSRPTAPTRSPLRAWRSCRPPVSAFYDLDTPRRWRGSRAASRSTTSAIAGWPISTWC